jgi:hypothetical protein
MLLTKFFVKSSVSILAFKILSVFEHLRFQHESTSISFKLYISRRTVFMLFEETTLN